MHGPTSFELFMSFVVEDEDGAVDTSGIVSRECYEKWKATRKGELKYPPRAFKDALKTIVLGSNRCKPFPPKVEESILVHLRAERVWPCFENDEDCNIGKRGWKILGYHEKRNGATTQSKPQQAGGSSSPKKNAASRKQAPKTKIEPPSLNQLSLEPSEGYSTDGDASTGAQHVAKPRMSADEVEGIDNDFLIDDIIIRSDEVVPDVFNNDNSSSTKHSKYGRSDSSYEFKNNKRRTRGFDDVVNTSIASQKQQQPQCSTISEEENNVVVNKRHDDDEDSKQLDGPDVVKNAEDKGASSGLMKAYDVFEFLCSYPQAGYDYKYNVVQALLSDNITKRFHELFMANDPRLEPEFICPTDATLVPGLRTMHATAVNRLDGTPWICISRCDDLVKFLGKDPLHQQMLASENPFYDSYAVYTCQKQGVGEKLLAGLPFIAQTIISLSPTDRRIIRHQVQVIGPDANGGVQQSIIMQDVTSLYPEIIKLGAMFPTL